MAYPTVRQQDEFFAQLGIDPFRNNVEIVTIRTDDDKPLTVLYCFERGGETRIAAHWPDEHQEMT